MMLMTTSDAVISETFFLRGLIDVGALLADHDAGTRRVNRHAALLVRALDHDACATAACFSSFMQHFANFDNVLMEELCRIRSCRRTNGNPRSG